MIEERVAKMIVNKSGAGNSTFRATLPAKWIREMGLDEDNRSLLLAFDGEKIIIKNKEEITMKAKVYEGIRLVIKRGEDIDDEFVNTLCKSVEEFEETNDDHLYGDEVIEKVDDVVLYRVDTAKGENLAELHDIRKRWNRRKHYRYLMTLDEIEKHLKENYLVAVEGLGEIESIDDIE